MWVIKVGDGARFVQVGFGIFYGGYSMRMWDFDCNGTAQLVVMSQIHNAEPALPRIFSTR